MKITRPRNLIVCLTLLFSLTCGALGYAIGAERAAAKHRAELERRIKLLEEKPAAIIRMTRKGAEVGFDDSNDPARDR